MREFVKLCDVTMFLHVLSFLENLIIMDVDLILWFNDRFVLHSLETCTVALHQFKMSACVRVRVRVRVCVCVQLNHDGVAIIESMMVSLYLIVACPHSVHRLYSFALINTTTTLNIATTMDIMGSQNESPLCENADHLHSFLLSNFRQHANSSVDAVFALYCCIPEKAC